MIDFSKFRYFASAYERPTFKYRCGRMARWGKACARGPNINGSCGGVTECTPLFRDGRHYCRRPKRAGGDCFDGPLPDGACSQSHPPCAPKRTLRVWRGRAALVAIFIVISLIAISMTSRPDGVAGLAFVDPGPLSGHHANLSIDGSVACSACHASAEASADTWLASVVTHADMDGQCIDCHGFDGPSNVPHNRTLFGVTRPELGETNCRSCHKEHKGAEADISKLTDAQCNTCHLIRFDSFSKDHLDFVKPFPYRKRNNIIFDHASHIGKHFSDPKTAANAPANCNGCHQTEQAARYVPVVGYQEACASCHEDQVVGREMAVLRFPEFDQNYLEESDILEACGLSAEQAVDLVERLKAFEQGDRPDPREAEEYFAYSLEQATTIGSFLTGIDIDDVTGQSEPLQQLFLAMARAGQDPLVDLATGQTTTAEAKQLFAGLSPELARQTACQWARNVEYVRPDAERPRGWGADEFSLLYRAIGHADPVMKAWMDFAATAPGKITGEEDRERALAMQALFADRKTGPGACAKCHALEDVSISDGGEQLAFKWTYYRDEQRSQKFFDHRPHLGLSGPETACESCHRLDAEADYAGSFEGFDPTLFISNFGSIERSGCVDCHNETGVREDCTLCHRYHDGPKFNKPVTRYMVQPKGEGDDGS